MTLRCIASYQARLVGAGHVHRELVEHGILRDPVSIFVAGVRCGAIIFHCLKDFLPQWSHFLSEEIFCFMLQINRLWDWHG